MHINDLPMYCACYSTAVPRHQQFFQIPLMCGSYSLTESDRVNLQANGFKFDDEGDNISNLNSTFAELTGIYYIWKNTDHEFVGHNQYRRFWKNYNLTTLEKNTLYYPSPLEFNVTTADQYIACLNENGLNFLKMVTQNSPKQIVYNSLKTMTHINACNMFFGQKVVYDKFCEVWFEIMFDVYRISEDYISTVQHSYEGRLIGFLAERVMTSLIHHKDYFFNGIKMIPVDVDLVD